MHLNKLKDLEETNSLGHHSPSVNFTLCNHVIRWLLTEHKSKDNLRFKWQLHPTGIRLHKHLQFTVKILSICNNLNRRSLSLQRFFKKICKPEKSKWFKDHLLATIYLPKLLTCLIFIRTFSFVQVLAEKAFRVHPYLSPFQKQGRKLMWLQCRIKVLGITEIKGLCLRSQSSGSFVNQIEGNLQKVRGWPSIFRVLLSTLIMRKKTWREEGAGSRERGEAPGSTEPRDSIRAILSSGLGSFWSLLHLTFLLTFTPWLLGPSFWGSHLTFLCPLSGFVVFFFLPHSAPSSLSLTKFFHHI